EQSMVRQTNARSRLECAHDGIFNRAARPLVNELEYVGERTSDRLGLRPAGQLLGDAVHECHAGIGVGADHAVADAGERDSQPLRLLSQGIFGLETSLKAALGVLQGNCPKQILFVVLFHLYAPPRISDASSVPSTRARIFSNAVSRLVE